MTTAFIDVDGAVSVSAHASIQIGGTAMNIESLIVWLIVGAIAGWLAGQVMKGGGFGLIGDIILGIVGALVAGWMLPQLGILIGGGILGGGLMATAGGLVFYGDGRGAFVAADAKNGKLLWHFDTGQNWKSGPMTYTVDGKQYVVAVAGSTVLSFGLR